MAPLLQTPPTLGVFYQKNKIFYSEKNTNKFFLGNFRIIPLLKISREKKDLNFIRGQDLKLSHPNLKIISESHDNYFSYKNLCI